MKHFKCLFSGNSFISFFSLISEKIIKCLPRKEEKAFNFSSSSSSTKNFFIHSVQLALRFKRPKINDQSSLDLRTKSEFFFHEKFQDFDSDFFSKKKILKQGFIIIISYLILKYLFSLSLSLSLSLFVCFQN